MGAIGCVKRTKRLSSSRGAALAPTSMAGVRGSAGATKWFRRSIGEIAPPSRTGTPETLK